MTDFIDLGEGPIFNLADVVVVTGMTLIMLTGRTSALDWVRGKAAGADTYLAKPFHPLELSRVVEQVMQSVPPPRGP